MARRPEPEGFAAGRLGSIRTHISVAVIALATLVTFVPALDGELVSWDDQANLVDNPHIRGLAAEQLAWMWTSSHLGVWQPLSWMLAATQYRLFGDADEVAFAQGVHATNIALQALAAILVFFVARRLIVLGDPDLVRCSSWTLDFGAALAALLFAVHPLRCEIVAWASGQPYLFALLGALGTVLCYLEAVRTGERRWHLAALACYAASLLSKAIAVPLVAVLCLLDVHPLRRWSRSAGLEKIPYAALAASAAMLAVWAASTDAPTSDVGSWVERVRVGYGLMFYVRATFLPFGLAPYYARPDPFDPAMPWLVGANLAAIAITLSLVVFRRWFPGLAVTWGVYVVSLLPVVGFVEHGQQIAADRYSTLSCIGFAILIGAGFVRLGALPRLAGARPGIVVVSAVSLVLVAGLASMAHAYTRVWHDSVSVWSAIVERNPGFAPGYYNLAKAQKEPCAGWLDRARELELLGQEQAAEELGERAAAGYRAAKTNYLEAIALEPRYPEANVDLGNMIRDGVVRGGAEAAMRHYTAALEGRPGFHMAHLNLAVLLIEQGRPDEAIPHLEQAEADALREKAEHRLPLIRQTLDRARRTGAGGIGR